VLHASLITLCRYGLAIGYYCSWLVRGLMALTSPISWPLGRLLDWLLGSEHTALYR
jgi:metal transporter CNNM